MSATMRHVQSCRHCRKGGFCEWGKSIARGEFGQSIACLALERAVSGQDVGEPPK